MSAYFGLEAGSARRLTTVAALPCLEGDDLTVSWSVITSTLHLTVVLTEACSHMDLHTNSDVETELMWETRVVGHHAHVSRCDSRSKEAEQSSVQSRTIRDFFLSASRKDLDK